MKKSLKWVSELTSISDEPTKNFIESLNYNSNAIVFNDLLEIIEDNEIEFELLNGFDYKSKNEKEKNFSIITIKLNDRPENLLNFNLLSDDNILKEKFKFLEKEICLFEIELV